MPGAPIWAGPNAGIPQRPVVTPAPATQGPRWPVLRFIAILLKVIAWIQLVLGIILALATAFAGSFLASNLHVSGIGSTGIGGTGIVGAIIVLVGAVFAFIWTYASSEIIMLFITIEKNTRPR